MAAMQMAIHMAAKPWQMSDLLRCSSTLGSSHCPRGLPSSGPASGLEACWRQHTLQLACSSFSPQPEDCGSSSLCSWSVQPGCPHSHMA